MHLLLVLALVLAAVALALAMRKDWGAATILAVLALVAAAFSGVPL